MVHHDILVIGASAGGIEPLCQIVRGLPPGLPASLFVVCHFPSDLPSSLPRILSGQGCLLARHAVDGEPIHPGQIYVAPPDYHLVLEAKNVRLSHGPRENRFRPAIDPLFRSAARVFGRRVVAVILSGGLQDGVAGLLAVRAAGGIAVVQDPGDALVPSLPQSAQSIAGADYVVPASGLAALLVQLVQKEVPPLGGPAMNDPLAEIAQKVVSDFDRQSQDANRGAVSMYVCPECGGPLWQLDEARVLRFRCHVGHIYSADALLQEQSSDLEAALWRAVRLFREKSVLARQMAHCEEKLGHAEVAARFAEEAKVTDSYGDAIQQYLLQALAPRPPAPGASKPSEAKA